ncbi:Dihydrofolate reductase [Lachnospiraceae bacterium TWA4]|nr:Dihydrofolate reductase [Lachnospiraceae bacterium TWA4]
MLKLIAAVDHQWGIGKSGDLLVSLPLDMKHFKEETMGKTVIMGRKTLESFPNHKPLPNRRNLVLTRNKNYQLEGIEVFHDINDLLSEDAYIIGGGEIYRQFLPYCEEASITQIRHSFEADTFFPNLDEDSEWMLVDESNIMEEMGYHFTFRTYRRK